MVSGKSPAAIAEELGQRLKRARLNCNLTQAEVALHAGVSRKAVVNAEQGKAQLEIFIAIMLSLELEDQLDLFLPEQDISPIQLLKLRGKTRQRASGKYKNEEGHDLEW